MPTSKTKDINVKQTVERVIGGQEGHYAQWVEGAIAGYGNKELSSPFNLAGPLTEAILMANLAIRAADTPKPRANGRGFDYPGSNMKLLWDHENMRVTNLEEVNQLVKREYRKGWTLGGV